MPAVLSHTGCHSGQVAIRKCKRHEINDLRDCFGCSGVALGVQKALLVARVMRFAMLGVVEDTMPSKN
jgi:hypothetical protein